MKPTSPIFAPGFRISLRDAIVLVVGLVVSVALLPTSRPVSLVIAFVVGHFFLFCNVFRISRTPELVWAGIFIALSGVTLFGGFPSWPITIAISLCVTVVVIILEMKKPNYHGIGWQQINPGLKHWWDANLAGPNPS